MAAFWRCANSPCALCPQNYGAMDGRSNPLRRLPRRTPGRAKNRKNRAMISLIARLLPVLFALLVFGPFTRTTCAEPLPLTIGVLSDLTGPYSALDGEGSVIAAR